MRETPLKYRTTHFLNSKNVLDMGTIRLGIYIHQRLNIGHLNSFNLDYNFKQWLAGVTDGDGTFWFGQSKKKSWDFTYKISQSTYNTRMLTYIKNTLKTGSITFYDNIVQYQIRNPQILQDLIIPIFESAPLLSKKINDFN
jgi:hypothetical protein